MDYNNPVVILFKDLGGLDNTIKRLQFEFTVEFSEGSNTATSTYDYDKGQNTLSPYSRY